MVDHPQSNDPSSPPGAGPTGQPGPRRGPGHRGTDARDSIAELAERAQLISQEAGSKVAAAMKDVISAGAGITGFAIESARDLVQYMVRRGQMTPEEGDKLIREAEAAHEKRPDTEKARPTATKIAAERAAAAKAEAAARALAVAANAPSYRPSARPIIPPASSPNGVPARTVTSPSAPAPRISSKTTKAAAGKSPPKASAKTSKSKSSKPATKKKGRKG